LARIKPNTIENTAVVRSSGWSILLFFAFLGVLFCGKTKPELVQVWALL